MRRTLTCLALLLFGSRLAAAQHGTVTKEEVVQPVEFCDLFRDTARYNGKTVKVTATYVSDLEGARFLDESCKQSQSLPEVTTNARFSTNVSGLEKLNSLLREIRLVPKVVRVSIEAEFIDEYREDRETCLAGCSRYTLEVERVLTAEKIVSSHYENVAGQIVAFSVSPLCLNGNASWSMLIRTRDSGGTRLKFIRVNFTLPCGKSPGWISVKQSVESFRLIRQHDCDEVLAGSVDPADAAQNASMPAMPIWKRTVGAEDEKLPFGLVLPCYRSVDLPLVPTV